MCVWLAHIFCYQLVNGTHPTVVQWHNSLKRHLPLCVCGIPAVEQQHTTPRIAIPVQWSVYTAEQQLTCLWPLFDLCVSIYCSMATFGGEEIITAFYFWMRGPRESYICMYRNGFYSLIHLECLLMDIGSRFAPSVSGTAMMLPRNTPCTGAVVIKINPQSFQPDSDKLL